MSRICRTPRCRPTHMCVYGGDGRIDGSTEAHVCMFMRAWQVLKTKPLKLNLVYGGDGRIDGSIEAHVCNMYVCIYACVYVCM